MRKNIITSITNWWANSSLVIKVLFCFSVLSIQACKKEAKEFNLQQLPGDGSIYTKFTDTAVVISSTLLLDDSIITNQPTFFTFGQVNHSAGGTTQAAAYLRLIPRALAASRVDFTGALVDSIKLIFDYNYVVGDTMLDNTLSVHELTTALDPNFQYRANTDFVTFNTTPVGTVTFKPRPKSKDVIRFTLTNTFGQTLLSALDDATSDEFQSNFNGIMIQGTNIASVITANRSSSSSDNTVFAQSSYLQVWFKQSGVSKTQVFYFPAGLTSFNKIQSDKSATLFSGLLNKGDEVSSAMTGNYVLAQSGTGTFIKLTFPSLNQWKSNVDSVIVINRAVLRVNADTTDFSNNPPVPTFVLAELLPSNEVKFKSTIPSLVQVSGRPQTGTGYPVSMSYDKSSGSYTAEITDYVQALMFNEISSDGIALIPSVNSFFVNYTYTPTLGPKPVRLEVYYTVVKKL